MGGDIGVDTTKVLARDGPSWSDIAKDPQEIILRWWEDSMSIIVVLHICTEYLLIAMKILAGWDSNLRHRHTLKLTNSTHHNDTAFWNLQLVLVCVLRLE